MIPQPIRPNIPLRLRLHQARGRFRQALTDLAYRQSLHRFQEFHAGLKDDRNVIYMFFTTGLLHWLRRALVFVPADANVALIGSGLSAEEQWWLRDHVDRPLHNVPEIIDDITVLDFVFQTTRHHFGWLHIDCFVLNPLLFSEMTTIADDAVANCIWSHPGANGIDTLHSAFVFLNYDVLQSVRSAGVEVSPSTYHYAGASIGRTITKRKLYSRVPTRRQIELLTRVLPPGPGGLPNSEEGSYFQLLVMYQLTANALGFRLNRVRRLVRDGSGSAEHYSDEIVHVNGVATYRRTRESERTVQNLNYFMLLQADFAMLTLMGDGVPGAYAGLREELAGELRRLGVSESQVWRNLQGFLAMRGISQDRCARLLSAN